MITELYAIDRQLVDNLIENIVTIELQTFSGGTLVSTEVLPAENIISESLEIKQSICDIEELKIGGCIPSQLTLNVMNTGDLSGKRIVVKIRTRYYTDVLFPSGSLYPSTTLYPNASTESSEMSTSDYILFVGPIYSCTKMNNHKIRKLIAFDRMYYASTVLCKNRVYNYLKQYGDRDITFDMLFNAFAAKARINVSHSDMVNHATVADIWGSLWQQIIDKNFTLLDFYNCLSELNGVFLIDDAPSAENVTSVRATARVIKLYQNKDQKYTISSYSSLSYEDFLTKEIRYAQFDFDKDNYFTYIYHSPTDDYSRYISENPVARCSKADFDIIKNLGTPYSRGYYKSIDNPDTSSHTGLRNIITGNTYQYRPFKASIFNRWWVQVGDRVKLPTNDPDVPYVESIVFSRTLKGLYGMRVEIEAKGVEIMGKENDESL